MVINKVTHQAETFLDLIRKMGTAQPQEVIDIVYQSSDFIRMLLDIVSEELTDKHSEEDSQGMIDILKDAIEKISSGDMSNNDEANVKVEESDEEIVLEEKTEESIEIKRKY